MHLHCYVTYTITYTSVYNFTYIVTYNFTYIVTYKVAYNTSGLWPAYLTVHHSPGSPGVMHSEVVWHKVVYNNAFNISFCFCAILVDITDSVACFSCLVRKQGHYSRWFTTHCIYMYMCMNVYNHI